MKSKRRHELQQNVLGVELGKIGHFFRARGNLIGWCVVAAAVVALIIVYVTKQVGERRRLPEIQYTRLTTDHSVTPDEQVSGLEALTQQGGNPRIAALAMVDLGDLYAQRLLANLPDRTPAERQDLADKARMWYLRTLDAAGATPGMVGRARLGLAQLALTDGDGQAARDYLQAVVDDVALAGEPVKFEAQQLLNELPNVLQPVPMATTAPAPPATQPAGAPASAPADEVPLAPTATQPATSPAE